MNEQGKQSSPEMRIKETVEKCKDIPWRCSACSFLLGWIDKETRSFIRMRYRDFWIEIRGNVKHICRRCGQINILEDSDYTAFLLHKKEFSSWLRRKEIKK